MGPPFSSVQYQFNRLQLIGHSYLYSALNDRGHRIAAAPARGSGRLRWTLSGSGGCCVGGVGGWSGWSRGLLCWDVGGWSGWGRGLLCWRPVWTVVSVARRLFVGGGAWSVGMGLLMLMAHENILIFPCGGTLVPAGACIYPPGREFFLGERQTNKHIFFFNAGTHHL